MNVKELLTNEELMNNIVEDIDEIPEDSEVTYEVWALGQDEDGACTGSELLIGEFSDPDEAVECAKNFELTDFTGLINFEHEAETFFDRVACFSIEVETVVEDIDGSMNIGTIYRKDLCLDSL